MASLTIVLTNSVSIWDFGLKFSWLLLVTSESKFCYDGWQVCSLDKSSLFLLTSGKFYRGVIVLKVIALMQRSAAFFFEVQFNNVLFKACFHTHLEWPSRTLLNSLSLLVRPQVKVLHSGDVNQDFLQWLGLHLLIIAPAVVLLFASLFNQTL